MRSLVQPHSRVLKPRVIAQASDPKSYSFLNKFKLLVKDPAKAIALFKFNFEDLMVWQKNFHIMQPITSAVFLEGLVERLQGSGAKVDLELLKNDNRPRDTFYACTCEDYQHYCWCVHVCTDAMTRNMQPPSCAGTISSKPAE